MTIDRTKQVLSEIGQTMPEYAVVLTLIIFVTVTVFTSLGDSIAAALEPVRNALP